MRGGTDRLEQDDEYLAGFVDGTSEGEPVTGGNMTDKERAEIDELRATVARLAVDVARLTGQGLQQYEVVKLGGLHVAMYVPRPCGWCIGWGHTARHERGGGNDGNTCKQRLTF